jgi:hypothetical protein
MKLQLWITCKNHYCELRQWVARWEEHVSGTRTQEIYKGLTE